MPVSPPRAEPRDATSPFVDFDRSSWAQLGRDIPLRLTAAELAAVQSLGDAGNVVEQHTGCPE